MKKMYESKTLRVRWKVKEISGRAGINQLHVDHFLKDKHQEYTKVKGLKVPMQFIFKLARDIAKEKEKDCPVCGSEVQENS